MEKQIEVRATTTKDTERQRQIEKEIQLNRKINFFVMREVWNITRGRATKEMEINRTIYEALEIRRERYSRAIETGIIRLTKEELKDLVNKTGVEKAIFEGKKHFALEKVTRNDWKELFDLRAENREEFNRRKQSIIERVTRDDLKQGTNLYKLSMYFKTGISTTVFSLEDILSRIDRVEFSQLDNCKMETLEKYLNALSEQVRMVEAIVQYKRFRIEK